jgi:plasmid replication initiation protein
MSSRHRTRSEREQLELFRALPGDLKPRDAQDLMAYPFFSLAKTHRVMPIDYRAGEIAIRVEAVPEHGMATIWDADILIWAASQIVQARDSGLRTSRLMAATPYEILTFIGRGDTACNRPPSPPRCARPTSAARTASPGSTNGPSAQTHMAAPTVSIS